VSAVLTAFAVVGVAILVGYIIGRIDLLGAHARYVLSRLSFFVLSPFLLFVVLSEADIAVLFSNLLPISMIAAFAIVIPFWLVARLSWKRSLGDTVIGALAAGQVNSNNIGIPFSVYLLGSAAFPAPVIFFQLLILTPMSMALLEAASSGSRSLGRIALQTIRNPVLIGSALGVLMSLLGWRLPGILQDPFHLIADAAIPILLLNYGISLHGQRVLTTKGLRRDVILATGLKLVAMPIIAWALGVFVFHIEGLELAAVVVLAALPTAQNVFNHAQRFDFGEIVARDVIFLTTLGCIPVLLIVSLLLL